MCGVDCSVKCVQISSFKALAALPEKSRHIEITKIGPLYGKLIEIVFKIVLTLP